MDRRSISEIFEPSFYSVISDRCRDNEAGQYDPDISAVKYSEDFADGRAVDFPDADLLTPVLCFEQHATEISIDSRLNSKIRVERFRSF